MLYLRRAKLVTAVYVERRVRVRLPDGTETEALTYVADRKHRQYAGHLDRERLLTLVRQGLGRSGPNAEYVLNTEAHLRELASSTRPSNGWRLSCGRDERDR